MRSFKAFFFAVVFFLAVSTLAAQDRKQLETYYAKAIPSVENFVKRLVKDGKPEPWENLGVRSLMDNVSVIVMAQVDLPEERKLGVDRILPLIELAEAMQDKDPESRTFGNFRWYWRTPEVTDRNAVEFVTARALPIWFEAKDKLPPEAKASLERMLRRSVDGCMKHHVRSNYTNITIYNFVHLILLGQVFDRPDVIAEGERRLNAFLRNVWDHGIFEYNSPTYYMVDIDALQLGYRYVKSDSAKQAMRTLLDYFWTDLALNWYLPGQRLAGAQSRTYDYVYGRGGVTRMAEFAGLAPTDKNARNPDYLNSFHASYQPGPDILKRNKKYPRLVSRRWGAAQGQWTQSYILKDIALGIAGAPYMGARQNVPLTVDLADYHTVPSEPPKHLPRCYFIADGRQDPYGVNRYPTSTAGHNKALHMEAFWRGAQRSVDALGVVMYTPKALNDPVLTDVQSHFVFRKPDAAYVNGKSVSIFEEPIVVKDKPVFFRYGNKAFGLRVLWTRDRNGKSPEAYLIDDGNKLGVQRLTIDHWTQGLHVSYDNLLAPPGAAFWVRIGSNLDTDEQFDAWCLAFAEAEIHLFHVDGDSFTFHVAGVDGPLSVRCAHSTGDVRSFSTPAPPKGILELDGIDLGRPILERLPEVQRIAKSIREIEPIVVEPDGSTTWEAEDRCFSLIPELIEANDRAFAGKAVRINAEFFWHIKVRKSDDYYLWARVFAPDTEHDSFHIDWRKQVEEGEKGVWRYSGDWHIGSGKDWRWVRMELKDGRPGNRIRMERGTWKLTLRPREQDGMIDRFFLTKDPKKKPE